MRPKFYLRNPASETETLVIVAAFVNGRRLQMSTGLSILPKHWNPKRQRAKKGVALEAAINARLERIQRELVTAFLELQGERVTPTPQLVRERYERLVSPPEEPAAPTDLVTYIAAYRARAEATLRPATLLIYGTTERHLTAFRQRTGCDLSLPSLDATFFERFLQYLLHTADLTNNSAAKVLKRVKTCCRAAEAEGIAVHPAYREVTLRQHRPQILALSSAELERIRALDLSETPRLARVRDRFLLSCFTGLRFSDLAQLRKEHVIDGAWIRLTVVKTGEHLAVPLTAPAREILERYPGLTFRPITNQVMNRYLKEICQLAEINDEVATVDWRGTKRVETRAPKWQLVSTHTGRRTFVTLSLERGVRPEVVMAVTGHKDLRSFQRYVEVTNRMAAEEIGKAWG